MHAANFKYVFVLCVHLLLTHEGRCLTTPTTACMCDQQADCTSRSPGTPKPSAGSNVLASDNIAIVVLFWPQLTLDGRWLTTTANNTVHVSPATAFLLSLAPLPFF
jgi:hypothetical protein